MNIKKFYLDNMKMVNKCWVNQVAISVFGLFVTFPISSLALRYGLGDIPVLVASIFAISFYLFLIYDAFWEFGGNCQNKNSEKYRTPFDCLKIGIFAYLPTLILITTAAILFLLKGLADQSWAGSAATVIDVIVSLLLRGMYLGVKYFVTDRDNPVIYLQYLVNYLSLIPMPIICFIAFKNGQNNKTIFKHKSKKEPAIKKEKLK